MFLPQHNNTTDVMWYRFIPALLVLFLFAILFSPIAMMTDQQGMMTNCPFEHGMPAMCPMTLADHFSAWKEVWLAVLPGVLAALVLVVFFFVVSLGGVSRQLFSRRYYWRYQWRLSYQPISYLKLFYADGTIQPRLYA